MTEEQRSLRYRVNISRGMKGSISWECTVELDGAQGSLDTPVHESFGPQIDKLIWPGLSLEQQCLLLSDRLVVELEKRYPITAEVK